MNVKVVVEFLLCIVLKDALWMKIKIACRIIYNSACFKIINMNIEHIIDKEDKKEIFMLDNIIAKKFHSVKITGDKLVSFAKANTKTNGEYNAFMKGCVFFFYKYCVNGTARMSSKYKTDSLEDIIIYLEKIIPNMTGEEKEEHNTIYLWLKKLYKYGTK